MLKTEALALLKTKVAVGPESENCIWSKLDDAEPEKSAEPPRSVKVDCAKLTTAESVTIKLPFATVALAWLAIVSLEPPAASSVPPCTNSEPPFMLSLPVLVNSSEPAAISIEVVASMLTVATLKVTVPPPTAIDELSEKLKSAVDVTSIVPVKP